MRFLPLGRKDSFAQNSPEAERCRKEAARRQEEAKRLLQEADKWQQLADNFSLGGGSPDAGTPSGSPSRMRLQGSPDALKLAGSPSSFRQRFSPLVHRYDSPTHQNEYSPPDTPSPEGSPEGSPAGVRLRGGSPTKLSPERRRSELLVRSRDASSSPDALARNRPPQRAVPAGLNSAASPSRVRHVYDLGARPPPRNPSGTAHSQSFSSLAYSTANAPVAPQPRHGSPTETANSSSTIGGSSISPMKRPEARRASDAGSDGSSDDGKSMFSGVSDTSDAPLMGRKKPLRRGGSSIGSADGNSAFAAPTTAPEGGSPSETRF